MSPGGRVGVAALSFAVEDQALEAGLDALRSLGFEPVPAANLRRRSGPFAGTDEERLAGFHELLADPDVEAVVFARGGHGVLRLLPGIDWELLARRPRAYVGYSDLTPLLLEVVRRTGTVAFHGPMVAKDIARGLDPAERESFLGALGGRPQASFPLARCLRTGTAEGTLLGGCLSMLVATLGTPWAPRLDGSILFFEDVDEPAYRIDRMLTQLGLSGSLAEVRGAVLGYLGGTWESGDLEAWQWGALADGIGPIGGGLAAGHGAPNLTLPLGLRCRLDAARGRLEVASG